jgi:hypothetical protein
LPPWATDAPVTATKDLAHSIGVMIVADASIVGAVQPSTCVAKYPARS